jgi:mannose-6-phosphate isomerase-like protein (cupin superfamily)
METYDAIAVAHTLPLFGRAEVAPFNQSGFFVIRPPDLDASNWEIHADTDEFLMVLEGSVTVEILTDHDSHLVPLVAGEFTVVPRGCWHRHTKARGVVELFYTPGSSQDSTAEDPRLEPGSAAEATFNRATGSAS